MFGKNEFLGEARVPLSSVNLSNCRRQIYALQDAVSVEYLIGCMLKGVS